MRREWSGIIKNRQWSEFESLAKSEPSQGLADTVAELERGLTEKADRRSLRKVLYILSQAGYEPQEIEEVVQAVELGKPMELGYMSSPDSTGGTGFAYGIEKQGRMRVLIAAVRPGFGIVDAFERAFSLEEVADFGRKYFSGFGPGSIECPVPPAYALGRLAAGLRDQQAKTPQAIAYWRSVLVSAEELPHPTSAMVPLDTDPEERRAISFIADAAMAWRLEMGSVLPMLQELHQSESSGVELTDEQRKKRNEEIFAKARAELFTPLVIADHAMRLRDLAYLCDLKGLPDVDLYLSAAVELDAKGSEAEYAKGLLEKTVALLLESWRRSSQKKGPAMRRFDAQ